MSGALQMFRFKDSVSIVIVLVLEALALCATLAN